MPSPPCPPQPFLLKHISATKHASFPSRTSTIFSETHFSHQWVVLLGLIKSKSNLNHLLVGPLVGNAFYIPPKLGSSAQFKGQQWPWKCSMIVTTLLSTTVYLHTILCISVCLYSLLWKLEIWQRRYDGWNNIPCKKIIWKRVLRTLTD